MANNLKFHSKTMHVDAKYHFIITLINDDIIKPQYCPFKDQTLDIFTKPLGKIKFTKLRYELGICKHKFSIRRGECFFFGNPEPCDCRGTDLWLRCLDPGESNPSKSPRDRTQPRPHQALT